MGLQPPGADCRQSVPQLGPELRLPPLEEDVGAEQLADGGVGQGAVLVPNQNKNQLYVFISRDGLDEARLVIRIAPLGSQVII